MRTSHRCPRACAALVCAILALCISLGAQAAGPKRVLILHSFGRDFAPYDTIASVFRTDLAQRSSEPISFVEANLDFTRTANEREEREFVEYLNVRFDDGPPDVVVTLGPTAARFYVRHRTELFPATPLVMGALDERFARTVPRLPNDSVVAGKVDLPELMQNVLQLLPQTETIAVVIGASELEQFWLGELKRELEPLKDKVKFQWLDRLSLAQMQQRVANLPPNSAVFYGLLIVDAAGIPHERQDALASLHAVANAPIFGIYESEIGKGVVGGPYTSQRKNGEHIATAALRALGALPSAPREFEVAAFESPVYDWRELDRWGIDPSRLPPGSEIRFKPPTIWDQHRVAILVTLAVLLLQFALIGGLLVQRARRRRAEQEARHLGGRILTAQEDERRRLAREMHDDVTQRLAALAIDAARVQDHADGVAIRDRLVGLSEDVHALSYRLHPSVIEDLGLVAALRVECNRVARQEPIRVSFDCHDVPKKVPPGTAICLFRVAQEALRNVARHAQASNVNVSLEAKGGGITLAVRDDGKGLAESRPGKPASLGLVSMRERVRLVGGTLDIVSLPDKGTSVVAWVPMKEAA